MKFSELTITHYDKTGLFSNCSVMLGKIIDFYNQFFREPNSIDSSNLFYRYKSIDDRNNNTDITHKFFKNYKELPSFIYDKNNMVIDYHPSRTQFSDYRNINLCYYKNFINKYF